MVCQSHFQPPCQGGIVWWMSSQILLVPLFTVLRWGFSEFLNWADMLSPPHKNMLSPPHKRWNQSCCPWSAAPTAGTRQTHMQRPETYRFNVKSYQSVPIQLQHLFFGNASRTSWKRPWLGLEGFPPQAGEPRMEQNLCGFPLGFEGPHFSPELANCRPLVCGLSRPWLYPQATLPKTWDLNMTSSEEEQVFQEKKSRKIVRGNTRWQFIQL